MIDRIIKMHPLLTRKYKEWESKLDKTELEILKFSDGISDGFIIAAISFLIWSSFLQNPFNVHLAVAQRGNLSTYSGQYRYNSIIYNFSYVLYMYSPTCNVNINGEQFGAFSQNKPNSLYLAIWKATYPQTTENNRGVYSICAPSIFK